GACGFSFLWRLEKFTLRRPACARSGRCPLLHAPQDGDDALAASGHLRRRVSDADPVVGFAGCLTKASIRLGTTGGLSLSEQWRERGVAPAPPELSRRPFLPAPPSVPVSPTTAPRFPRCAHGR